jgi:hypothetical protein
MWIFEGKEFSDVPKDIIGFVYMITNTQTGKRYIGKKLFTRSKTKQVKGKRKRSRVESDWKEYYGSSKQLLSDIAANGREHFHREILYLCKSKGTCSYYEAKLQFQYAVLEHPDLFYNDQIMCRIHRTHVKI